MSRRTRRNTAITREVRFCEFIRRALQLQDKRLLKQGLRTGFTVQGDRERGVSFSSRHPDEEDLIAFLATLRLFFLTSDEVSINVRQISKIANASLTSAHLLGRLHDSKREWRHVMNNGCWRLVVDDALVRPERLMDLWINGEFLHCDLTKRKELQDLCRSPELTILSRHQFLDAVAESTRHILLVADVLECAQRYGHFR